MLNGLEWSGLPDRTILATFCMSEDFEEVYQKLEEVTGLLS